jgi:hypothetical protein
MTSPTPFTDRLREEGQGLIDAAEERGLTVRLIGGVGISLSLGARMAPAFERPYRDIDVITRKRDSRALEQLLPERGWEPAVAFNALNGGRRLLFHDPLSEAQVDVFVESFEMCHRLPLADVLDRAGPSLPATELLMTKLQIVELNAKDRNDCYALLLGCELRDGDHAAIEPARLAGYTAADWGLHHTFELNFERLHTGLESAPTTTAESMRIAASIDAIAAAMEEAEKGRGWRMRQRIGERKRWYDDPEEVDRAPGE